ncbi:hypothetical protein D3C78_1644370 [compost metagenome]
MSRTAWSYCAASTEPGLSMRRPVTGGSMPGASALPCTACCRPCISHNGLGMDALANSALFQPSGRLLSR